jgi:hypothetical protein
LGQGHNQQSRKALGKHFHSMPLCAYFLFDSYAIRHQALLMANGI